ncbi:unnamed protein product [Cuscuta campestris]|uniref:HMA domain-containing protein n=1 Tax=Cuscuta campestris TaxID=132261 RepID=A0A484L8Q4_9ASTE|nr:unnamed protein product [Cuscuta campestris]
MMVPLYSHGCERKIKNSLSHLRGIYSVNVEFDEQKVTVWGICNKYDVLSTIRAKRRGARFWDNADDVSGGGDEPSPSLQLPVRKRRPSVPPLTLLKTRPSLITWKLSLKKALSRSHSFVKLIN